MEKIRGKQRLFAFITLIIGLMLALAVLELSFRLFINFSNTACGVMQPDPDLGTRFKPNLNLTLKTQEFTMHLVTSSIGLKDREYEPKKANEFRILALGDSFTEGAVAELNQTYVKQLEMLLDKDSKNIQYSVINTGVSGYGSNQERIMLEKFGLKMKPDLVMVFFYLNDPESDYSQRNGPDQTVVDGCVVSRDSLNKSTFSKEGLDQFLLKHLRTYYFVKVIVPNFPVVKNSLYPIRNLLVKTRVMNPPELRYFILKSEYGDYEKEAFDASLSNLEKISSITKAENIKLVLVMIPMKFQVYDALWQDYKERNLIPDGEYDFTKPSSILGDFSKKEGIIFVDLLPQFRNMLKDNELNESIYYADDPHFNAYGNMVTADILYAELIKRGLLPR